MAICYYRDKGRGFRISGFEEAKSAIEEKLETEPRLESKRYSSHFDSLTMRSVNLSGSVSASEDGDKAVRIAKLYAGDREVESHPSMGASLRLKLIFSFSRLQAHLSS